MLSREDMKAQKHFLLGALFVGLVLLGINAMTGFFTRMHLENEMSMAVEHGAGSALYKQMLDELIDGLQSHIDWKRQIAALELGHLGAGATRAIPDLRRLLIDEHKEVRIAAALALARIGNYTPDMVQPLGELLQGPVNHDKYHAAKALGLIGPDANEAIPLLEQELPTGHQEVNMAIREALDRIDPKGNR